MSVSRLLAGTLLVAVCLLSSGCNEAPAPAETAAVAPSPTAKTVAEPVAESPSQAPAAATTEPVTAAASPAVSSPAIAPEPSPPPTEAVATADPTPATPVAATPVATTPAAAPPVVAKKKQTAAGLQDIDFDTIKLDLQKDEKFDPSKLTPAVKDLDGEKIRIRGYLLPSFQQTGITQFVLVRDNQECCFGPGAALHDCILVEMLPGKSTDYTVRPVAVEGKFSLIEFKDPDGVVRAIYHLDGQTVK
jgi:hypothetical protein